MLSLQSDLRNLEARGLLQISPFTEELIGLFKTELSVMTEFSLQEDGKFGIHTYRIRKSSSFLSRVQEIITQYNAVRLWKKFQVLSQVAIPEICSFRWELAENPSGRRLSIYLGKRDGYSPDIVRKIISKSEMSASAMKNFLAICQRLSANNIGWVGLSSTPAQESILKLYFKTDTKFLYSSEFIQIITDFIPSYREKYLLEMIENVHDYSHNIVQPLILAISGHRTFDRLKFYFKDFPLTIRRIIPKEIIDQDRLCRIEKLARRFASAFMYTNVEHLGIDFKTDDSSYITLYAHRIYRNLS